MRWISGILEKIVHPYLVALAKEVKEKTLRLESQVLELTTELEAVRESHMKLLKRSAGRLGGRPAAQSETHDVADLSGLTKDQLRQHFADEIKRRGPASRN